ncbi:stage II sporulation protein P [Niallia circulans]|uniref:Stage II sporulation protein P n=1 Tax=Niallia circulans TaxID=1397 RepID=A0A553SMA5_NIACI|nr:stage II sporulation protein P [Niallia circulans]TRZ38124.1 stage II sporulation protein P [Niallia circulans]
MPISKFKYYFQFIYTTILGVILVFILISGATTSFVSQKFSSDYIRGALEKVDAANLYSQLFNFENHYFPKEGSTISLSNLFFQVATNIRLDDTRTLLGRELPQLSFYHTKIIVAEEGTTIAQLPYESTPSEEILKNPKEADEEKIADDTPKTDDNNTHQTSTEKRVLIYQTHNLESYLPLLKNAEKPDDAISADERVNVVSLGSKLTSLLQKDGIGVQHDKTNMNQKLLDRKWKYTASYSASSEVVETAISENKDLTYLIDIHRDSARKKTTTATINGKSYAKIVFVVGEGYEGYEKNQAFAKKLHKELAAKYPGISRGVYGKSQDQGNGIYNQNYSDKAILLEVGGVDNNQEELNRTIDAFADVFSEIYWEENGATEQ